MQDLEHRDLSRPMAAGAKAYFWAFAAAAVVCWSPSKALSFVLPGATAVALLAVRDLTAPLLRASVVFALLSTTWMSILVLNDPDFVFQNAGLSLITYSSFFVPFAIPANRLRNPALLRKTLNLALVIVAFEASVGLVQGAYGATQTGSFDIANGDYIEGTIAPGLPASQSLANPMFAVNVAFLLLAVLSRLRTSLTGIGIFLFGILVFVLASVMHMLVFFVIAVACSTVFYRPPLAKRPWIVVTAAALCLVTLLTIAALLPTNLRTLELHWEDAAAGHNFKFAFAERVLTSVPKEHPIHFTFGFGPGQFASRAGLIGTGLYFGGPQQPRPLPLLQPVETWALQKYFMDLWWEVSEIESAGSTTKPHSSWLAVFTEAGLVGFMLTSIVAGWLLIRVRGFQLAGGSSAVALSFGASLIFLFLLGAQDLYWETPQAVFLGCLLLKLLYANAKPSTPVATA